MERISLPAHLLPQTAHLLAQILPCRLTAGVCLDHLPTMKFRECRSLLHVGIAVLREELESSQPPKTLL